jgi:uncharacterized protein
VSAEASPQLLVGTVRHTRFKPVRHAFAYPTFMLLLPMRAWARRTAGSDNPFSHVGHFELARNRRAWVSFADRDHGNGGPDALVWIERLLADRGIADADGEIWLLTYPRVLGFVFKPVSFWYCHRADGRLRAIVAEVNNTFGERHCYLLDSADLTWGREARAAKAFHVSPFLTVEGSYRFRFARTADRLVARVDHHDAEGPRLTTSVGGPLQPLTAASLTRALVRMPLLTVGVVARIHWQALRLWLKRVPLQSKPPPPLQPITRQSSHGSLSSPRSAAEPPLLQPHERPA